MRKLIAGPTAFIRDECTILCMSMVIVDGDEPSMDAHLAEVKAMALHIQKEMSSPDRRTDESEDSD